jgi:Domain of unknown function (DUF4132)
LENKEDKPTFAYWFLQSYFNLYLQIYNFYTMTISERQAIIAKIREENQDDYTFMRVDDECESVYAYVLDGSAPFPKLTDPNAMWTGFLFPLFAPFNEWTDEDHRLMRVITHRDHWNNNQNWVSLGECFITYFIRDQACLLEPKGIEIMPFVLKIWQDYNLNEARMTERLLKSMQSEGWYIGNTKTATSLGRYLIAAVRKDMPKMLGLVHREQHKTVFLELLVHNDPTLTDDDYDSFLQLDPNRRIIERITVGTVRILLEKDAKKYENKILEACKPVTDAECMYWVHELLRQHLPEKYADQALAHARIYIDMVENQKRLYKEDNSDYKFDYTYENDSTLVYLIENAVATLLKHDADAEKDTVFGVYKMVDDPQLKSILLKQILPYYNESILKTLFDDQLNYKDTTGADDFCRLLCKTISAFDFSEYESQVWAMATGKDKKIAALVPSVLAKLGDHAIPNAQKLLNDKKSDNRQTGAIILSLIQTPAATEVLMQRLNSEMDDNSRDIILETIKNVMTIPQTEAEIRTVIADAKARKKLDKPFERWLVESEMPRLYWLSGAELTDDETRFLSYRQTRSKDIRIDTEAKPMLALLDKTKSAPFAAAVLKAFIDNGADTKAKHCLALVTSLGSDAEIDVLKSKVLYWVDNARGKMAEYAVKAIALNGGTKALRLIEFYARKYKSKYKNIGAAANEAFDLVAEELGIAPYDLADTIIPDFGFEGLFKEFEAGGETYRAFISNDFKIMFLDEDNKIIKTVPKTASNELKDDFKDTAKEIKDIVKAQTSRLEQYLVIQRQWSAEKWQTLFLQNPVMFAYAVRLVWAAYSTENKLLYTFRCTEDQTLVNTEGDEIELADNVNIAILHPIALDAATLSYWNNNLIDSDVTPPFAQLLRPVVLLDAADKSCKMSDKFKGVQYGGYGFLGRMEKTGWAKGSIVDAGMISSYYKDFSSLGITAVIEQTGTHCVGYYEQNAEMGSLYFVHSKGIKFGSYYYDDPRDANDPRLIAFGDVPAIVYSEVMADLAFFEANRA